MELPATADDLVLSCLSPRELHRYSLTHKGAALSVRRYTTRAFNISTYLSRFFTPLEIQRFRELQSQTGTLISGSMALQFFERTLYPDSDLDLYAEHRHAKAVGQFLSEIGYLYVPAKSHSPEFSESHTETPLSDSQNATGIFASEPSLGYFGRGVARVFNFHKYLPDRKIQLITSMSAPLEVIMTFHSTCVMNLISHERAYSLYPVATHETRRSLVCATEGSDQEAARNKYAARGWAVEASLPERERYDSPDFGPRERRVGDRHCWSIKVLPELDLGLWRAPDPVESNTWSLSIMSDGQAEMKFQILRGPVLRYCYLLSESIDRHYVAELFVKHWEKKSIDVEFHDFVSRYYKWREWKEYVEKAFNV